MQPLALIKYGLIILELLHCVAHAKVLLSLGKPYTKKQYREKGAYFVVDAASVLCAWILLSLHVKQFGRVQLDYPVTALVSGHFFLHLFYIVRWRDLNSFAANSIINYSSEKRQTERVHQYGLLMYLINTTGTAFDLITHAYLAYRLIAMG